MRKSIPAANHLPVNRPHRSKRGFSMIEALVAMGLLGGLALMATSLVRNSLVGQKTASSLNEARDITNSIANGLTNRDACLASFKGLNPQTGANETQVKDPNGKVLFNVGGIYGNRTIKLTSIEVGGSGTDPKTGLARYTASGPNAGLALVVVSWIKTNETNGPSAIPRFFFMNVTTDSNGLLDSCMAAANGMSDTIWQRNPSDLSKIFYNDGNVGIGSTTPQVALDVNGAIRPGAATIGTTCTSEGSLGYDAAAHAPVFCDKALQWAKTGFAACHAISSSSAWGTSAKCPAGETMTGAGGGTYVTQHYDAGSTTILDHLGANNSTVGAGAYTVGGNQEGYWASVTFVICCQ